jgi:hypothetical protein
MLCARNSGTQPRLCSVLLPEKLCQWKSKFGAMEVSGTQLLKQMEDENRRHQLLMAELGLHGDAPKLMIRKNAWSLPRKRLD